MGCCGSREEEGELVRKVAVIGDREVGKTCFIRRYIHDDFDDDTYIPTSLNVEEKVVALNNGKNVKLLIYDTGGEDTFKHLTRLNYPRSDAAIICVCIDHKESLKRVNDHWIPEMKKLCPGIPIILAGLRKDIRDEIMNVPGFDNFVRESDGKAVARKHKLLAYKECSASEGKGVGEIFQLTAAEAAKKKNTRKNTEDDFKRV